MTPLSRLRRHLQRYVNPVIAVSGDLDSTTLALSMGTVAKRVRIFHAVSPAVPPAATARVRTLAVRYAWDLEIERTGEFDDPNYLRNPPDRCYYCKKHLYAFMRRRYGSAALLSGTNSDDLQDFRPGLRAAAEIGVAHPYVECGISKTSIRSIARRLGHEVLAELPSSPCLASRIATETPIERTDLEAVNAVESFLRQSFQLHVVRCRIHPGRVEIQVGADEFERFRESWLVACRQVAARLPRSVRNNPVSLLPYRRGSAFRILA